VKPASNYGASWAEHPLDSARARRVVELAVERSGWRGGALPRGRGRGIAVHRSFLSYVAMVVEVEVLPDGTVLVPRATVAVDAGFIANPDRARAQMEGALVMAMSNVLAQRGHLRQRTCGAGQLPRLRRHAHAGGAARGGRAPGAERGVAWRDR
jgi:isoquinoline 1-oxidoreductase subunit beta